MSAASLRQKISGVISGSFTGKIFPIRSVERELYDEKGF
jgi:hypothetical protein